MNEEREKQKKRKEEERERKGRGEREKREGRGEEQSGKYLLTAKNFLHVFLVVTHLTYKSLLFSNEGRGIKSIVHMPNVVLSQKLDRYTKGRGGSMIPVC